MKIDRFIKLVISAAVMKQIDIDYACQTMQDSVNKSINANFWAGLITGILGIVIGFVIGTWIFQH